MLQGPYMHVWPLTLSIYPTNGCNRTQLQLYTGPVVRTASSVTCTKVFQHHQGSSPSNCCFHCIAGNNYTGVWINAFTWMLTLQAVVVLMNPNLSKSRPARFYAWCWYCIWMFACAIILLIGMHYKDLISQYSWAFLWLPPIGVLGAAVLSHRTIAQIPCDKSKQVDVEANAADVKPPTCSRGAWRKCWFEFWAFCAWSSMFWLSFLVRMVELTLIRGYVASVAALVMTEQMMAQVSDPVAARLPHHPLLGSRPCKNNPYLTTASCCHLFL